MGHKRYDQEFKVAAVRLVTEQHYTYKKAAQGLGVTATTLRLWKQQFLRDGLVGVPAQETAQQELRRLRQENRELTMERDILKKAATYFASQNR